MVYKIMFISVTFWEKLYLLKGKWGWDLIAWHVKYECWIIRIWYTAFVLGLATMFCFLAHQAGADLDIWYMWG